MTNHTEPVTLLSPANGKVGRIHLFGLPPVDSCPGASPTCLRHCYARGGRYHTRAVQARLRRSWEATRDPFFSERLALEIRLRRVRVLRIHDAGDFFDPHYIRQWAQVICTCPATRFYAYTRSYRLPGLREAMERHLVPLPNLRLWYSADDDTGLPADVPAGVRVAYLQTARDARVPAGGDLVFRVNSLRSRPAKRVGLVMVCPTEQGTGVETTCRDCGHCWR